MITIEVDLPTIVRRDDVDMVSMIECLCRAESLTLMLRGTLASYPGCTHWHFKQGKSSGTLELTWWPTGNRLWFKVAGGRSAVWIDACLPKLKASLERSIAHYGEQ